MSKELTIREIQLISLEILKTVSDICERLNLRYFLMYGTLIGAIRHQGYIPWDDDVDIVMPRPDYDKLIDHLMHHKYEHLTLYNLECCPNYPYMISRVSDDRYILRSENEESVGMGVFIDIFPYDGLGVEKNKAIRFGLKCDLLSSLCFQATRDHFAIENTKSPFRIMIKYPVYLFSKLIGKNYFQKKLKALSMKYPYEKCSYVGCAVWLSEGVKDIFLRKWFNETVFVPFEKYEFRIPKAYDIILRHTYGDYMKLPPESERIGHHYYKAYRK